MEFSVAFPWWLTAFAVLIFLGGLAGLTLGKTKVKVRLHFKGGSHFDFWSYTDGLEWSYNGEALTKLNWTKPSTPKLNWVCLSDITALTIVDRKKSVWDWITR